MFGVPKPFGKSIRLCIFWLDIEKIMRKNSLKLMWLKFGIIRENWNEKINSSRSNKKSV